MNIKMIITDLDGTLLDEEKNISNRNQQALLRCRELGIKTAYATGRGGTSQDLVSKLSNLFDGRAVQNGALAYVGNEVVYNRLLAYESVRPLLTACTERGLRAASQFDGMHYANFKVSDEWSHISHFEIVDFALHDKDGEKVYILINNHDDVSFIETHLPADAWMSVSRDGMAMIMHKEATKSNAIIALGEYWGIASTEIAAFGDDLNDIDMLNHAGVSVAMGNALDDVKAAADYICDTNDNDGVAKWLEENVL
jgi:Cof subfamily protein (haloacid dehalogenase superfamily)